MAWKAKGETFAGTWLKVDADKGDHVTLCANESYSRSKKVIMHNNPFLIFMGWDASVVQESEFAALHEGTIYKLISVST